MRILWASAFAVLALAASPVTWARTEEGLSKRTVTPRDLTEVLNDPMTGEISNDDLIELLNDNPEESFFENEELELLPKPQEAKLLRGLARIIGVALGVIAFVALVCVICCCCCPFCLLAKRRERGRVLNPPPTQSSQQPGAVPLVNQGQGGGYPSQQSYPPQQGYPPQPGYPSQQSYPPQQQYPPYGGEQPPPYPGPPEGESGAEYGKTPAYNPNAAP